MERIMNEVFEPEDLDKFGEEVASTEDSVSVAQVNEALSEGEDLLLAEIDAFRSKATQLQQLINAKESKAVELEAVVEKLEATNRELQVELAKKQEAADSLVSDVETQVDRMMTVVKNNMDVLESQISAQVSNNHENYQENTRNFQETLTTLSAGLGAVQTELSEKTHNESVHLFRLIQDTLKENDRTDEIISAMDRRIKSLSTMSTVLIVSNILTLCVAIAVLLRSLGVI